MLRTLLSCLSLGIVGTALAGSHGPLASLGASLAGGVAGNLATDFFKVLDRRVADRFLVGGSIIDSDHRVDRALRLAQINGLRDVLQRFDSVRRGDLDNARQNEAERLSGVLRDFLDREARAAQSPSFVSSNAGTTAQQAIRAGVLQSLPESFNSSLAARRNAGEQSAMAESLRLLRTTVEAAVLEEVRQQTLGDGEIFPNLFCTAFYGTTDSAGWFDQFQRHATEALSNDAGLEQIWNAQQVALVRSVVQAHDEILDRIDRRTERIEQAVTDSVAAQSEQQRRLERLVIDAAGGGAPAVEALAGIRDLLRVGIPDIDSVPADKLAGVVKGIIETLQRPAARPEAFIGVVNQALTRAQARAGELAFVDAAAVLDAALAQTAAEDQERSRGSAALLSERAQISRLQLRYREASAFHKLAATAMSFDFREVWHHLMAAAGALSDLGREFGDNTALAEAIALYRNEILPSTPRERMPLAWARTHNDLGAALQALGERESSVARLQEASAAYRSALEEHTRERVPLDWAGAQNNLGTVLVALGERTSGTAQLEQAVAAYRAALQEYTLERMPLQWVILQNNLGNALRILGERESGTARLQEAVAVCRAALQEWTRERVPLLWAPAQNNLGNALKALGERESGTSSLQQAVAAYRAALREWTRDRAPLDWAMTQNNLGNALTALGERESRTVWLKDAVKAYREALKERTRDRVPLDWAMTQNNLGGALQALGTRASSKALLNEAILAYQAALEEHSRERLPLRWAMTQNNLGNALSALGEREIGTARLHEAMVAYHSALEERTHDRVPADWAQTQYNLGNVLLLLGGRETGTIRLEEAVRACDACLTVGVTAWPPEWVRCVNARREAAKAEIARRSFV